MIVLIIIVNDSILDGNNNTTSKVKNQVSYDPRSYQSN